MGILGFLRKKEAKKITLEKIHDWLDSYAEKTDISTTSLIYSREVRIQIQNIKDLLTELEKATLKEENVYNDRAKSIMHGNRKTYIQKISGFIANLKTPNNYKELNEILEETSEALDDLAKETQRNYFVLREFLEEQIRPIAEALQEIDKSATKARNDLEKTQMNKIDKIHEKLKQLTQTELEISNIKKDIHEIESKIEGQRQLISDSQGKIAKTKATASYRALEDAEEEHKKAKAKLTKAKTKAEEAFSDIKPALKKYANQTKDKQAQKYAENPIEALLEDENLEITQKLNEIEKNMESLGIKEDKQKRIREQIKKLHNINTIREDLEEAIRKENVTENRIKNNHAGLEIHEFEKRIKITEESINSLEAQKQKKHDALERYNPRVIKQDIRDLIKELDPWTELSI